MTKRTLYPWALASVAFLGAPDASEGAHSFQEFGGPAAIIRAGEGVEFLLGGVEEPGPVLAELSFHLHLFLNNGGAGGAPELLFSPGDVLRFTLGGTSIVYDYDNPANILDPPFMGTGYFDAANVNDNFGPADPIGLAFGASDTEGTVFTLEVLAGDGVRFSGLELADTRAGTIRKAGASTFVRHYLIGSPNTILIDFETMSVGEIVTDQFAADGVTFFGDRIYDEQIVVDAFGAGLDRLEGRFLVNQSATPSLGRKRFVGVRFAEPVFGVRFDFAGPATLRAAAFDGDFVPENLLFVREFPASPGPSGLMEGSVAITVSEGFDGLILPAQSALLLDHLEVTFFSSVTLDFEGLADGTVVDRQFEGMGLTFFGARIGNDGASADAVESGIRSIEGSYLVNDLEAPATGPARHLGVALDRLASAARFDFAGASTLRVEIYQGGFAAEHLVGVQDFDAEPGATGGFEGKVDLRHAPGFDGLMIAADGDEVRVDNVSIRFAR